MAQKRTPQRAAAGLGMLISLKRQDYCDAATPSSAFLTRDAQKITPSRREPCSSRETFLEVVVNLDEIRTERNSLRDNGVDFASVFRNHERLIAGKFVRGDNYDMHHPRAVWVDFVGAALVLKSGRAAFGQRLHAVYENIVLLDKFAQTVELYDPNRVLQSGDFSVRGIDWHETRPSLPLCYGRTKFDVQNSPWP